MGFECGIIDSKTGSTGTQQYSVLSAEPEGMMFRILEVTAVDTDTTGSLAISTGLTDGTNDGAILAAANGGTVNSDNSTTECILLENESGTALCKASLDSWNGTSFTLNFSAVPASTAYKIEWMAWSGFTATYCDRFAFGTGSSAARTGYGFQPSAAIIVARKATRNGYSVGWTVGTAAADQAAMGFRWRNTANARYISHRADTYCAVMGDDSATVEQLFSLNTFGADGLTIDRDSGDADNADFVVLAFQGGDWYSSSLASPTTATTASITGGSFTPEGYILNAVDNTGTSGDADDVPWSYGASDGTNEICSHLYQLNRASENQGVSSTKVLRLRTDSTTNEEADHSTLNTDGITLSYSTAESAQNRVMALMFAEAAAGGATGKSNPLMGPLGGPLAGPIN